MKALEEELSNLHGQLARELTDRIKNGDTRVELVDCDGAVQEQTINTPVSSSILSVARQFLKDNHIEAGIDNKDVGNLVDSLPFSDTIDDDTTDPQQQQGVN